VIWSVIATLVPVHIYQCTKLQLPSSISLRDMAVQVFTKKWGFAYTLDAPSGKIYTCSPSICKYQSAHQIAISSSIIFRDMVGSRNKKWGCWSCRHPLADTFYIES